MAEKRIEWCGSSLNDLKNDKIFTVEARKNAGHQLRQLQQGLNPDDWKAMPDVGDGVCEIRIDLDNSWYRLMYVAKFQEAVYVLHCFNKKSNKTPKKDITLAKERLKQVVNKRKKG